MITPDLTEVLKNYCDWDYVVRNKFLRYASALLKESGKINCRGITYHNIEDMKVDLDADCFQLDGNEEQLG